MGLRRLVILVLLAVGTLVSAHGSTVAAGPTVLTGTIGGAAYKIEVPPNWNGTLVLYSHGYEPPGSKAAAQDVGDPVTGGWLLANGYALAGSAYSAPTGWAVEQALHDQIALLDYFSGQFGQPKRTIAWGHSLGGLITAGLIQQYPSRFSAALPMCGVLAGGVSVWNGALDAAFAFKTLLGAGAALQIVHLTDPSGNLKAAEAALAAAQSTPQGRARVALAASLISMPGWYDPATPAPAPSDYAAQEQNQALWFQNIVFPFFFAFRADLEQRSGGNPSWNTGVNYGLEFLSSSDVNEVTALYQQAGLNLMSDLQTLNKATRVAADANAVAYLTKNIAFTGQISVPVLTMHTTGDGLVPVVVEQAYARAVAEAGNSALLRQLFVNRAGHCSFTPAETVTAFQTLIRRLDTGTWGAVDPGTLNASAAALGPTFNITLGATGVVPAAPAFLAFQPSTPLRPYQGAPPSETGATSLAFTTGGSGTSGLFLVSFTSAQPGRGEVFFGPGPGCSGLTGVATRDLSPGSSNHLVLVAGNDLPRGMGDVGVQPGATYWYEAVTITGSGTVVDNNAGRCYTVTIPQSPMPFVSTIPHGDLWATLLSLRS